MEPLRSLHSICVFCGASSGNDPRYAAAATAVGERLAGRGIQLVYGGGRLGLMGAVADGALAAGGRVVGEERELGPNPGHAHPARSLPTRAKTGITTQAGE